MYIHSPIRVGAVNYLCLKFFNRGNSRRAANSVYAETLYRGAKEIYKCLNSEHIVMPVYTTFTNRRRDSCHG